MNKKFLSAILFGALMVTSTGTFVSCKDYDDDIDQINTELDGLKDQIAALQSKVNSGEWVSGVTNTADGITVTLGNGQKFDIKNGKDGAAGAAGAAGENGKTPKIAVNNEIIQVSYDDGATWTDLVALADLKGAAGEAAAEPIFSVGEDGHIYVQMGEEGEKKDLGVSTGGIYYVEDGPAIKLHICDENGEWNDVVLPRTAGITSIAALTIGTGDKITSDLAKVTLTYGKVPAGKKYLDGTAIPEGTILTSDESVSSITAQINPTMADASVYNFYLADSKGASIFTLGAATPNKTDKPLSRAKTVNEGIYDFAVTFVDGVTKKQIADYVDGSALAIATKDAFDNEILSKYDVTLNVVDGTTKTPVLTYYKTIEIEVNTEANLGDFIDDCQYVADIQYSIAKDKTATADAMGLSLSADGTISATQRGTFNTVTVKYLSVGGETKTTNISVKFVTASQENNLAINWTVNNETVKDSVDVTAYGLTQAVSPKYTSGDKKGNNAEGITGAIKSYTDDYGYTKTWLVYTFVPKEVVPGTYEAVYAYNADGTSELIVSVTITDPNATYDFKPLSAYFNADKTEATAYGKYDNGITYDLYNLFNVKDDDKGNVYFSETVPTKDGKKDNLPYKASKWLAVTDVTDNDVEWGKASTITVDKAGEYKNAASGATHYVFGGAYYARQISVKYVPFGNDNLTPVTYTFNLTVKSEIFEGTLEYVTPHPVKDSKGNLTGEYTYTEGKTKEINGDTVSIKLNEFLAEDVYGTEYKLAKTMDTRLNNVKVVLADDEANQYLRMTTVPGIAAKDVSNWDGTEIKVFKASSNTAIVTPPTCTIQIQVTDQWGKTKTADIKVKINK